MCRSRAAKQDGCNSYFTGQVYGNSNPSEILEIYRFIYKKYLEISGDIF